LNVQSLSISDCNLRLPAPSLGPELAAALPELREFFWNFEDNRDKPASLLCYNRVALAKDLTNVQLRPYSKANIIVDHYAPFYQDEECDPIVPTGASYDPLSASFRIFSRHLSSLTLQAHVDSTLFWPSPHEPNATVPTWPCLRTLSIKFNMVAPSGAWYFKAPAPDPRDFTDREFDSMDYDPLYHKRHYVEPTMITPLLAALAMAVRNMPVLEHFKLRSELGQTHFDVSYYGPGQEADRVGAYDEHILSRRVDWDVGDEWMPDDYIREGLLSAGMAKFGGAAVETFLVREWY